MLRLVLLLLMVFALAGGGVGTWYYGIRGEPIPGLSDGETKAEAEASASMRSDVETDTVPMDPLSFPVMQEGRVTKLMTMELTLRVTRGKGVEAVVNNRAKLRDAFLTELHSLYSLKFVRENDDQLGFVKRRLLKAGQKIVGNKLRSIEYQAIQDRDVGQKS